MLLGRDAFPGVLGVADGLVADPELVVDPDGKTLHLFMSSEAVDSKGEPIKYGVSHATSTDGVHWTLSQGNPVCTHYNSRLLLLALLLLSFRQLLWYHSCVCTHICERAGPLAVLML